MTWHFIKRDFNSYKFFWVILMIFSCLGVPAILRSEAWLFLLGYGYFFFGLVPINNLTGVTWRSQHVMSRNYLLSLPIKRKSLFLITQVRALVYFGPFAIYALSAPFLSQNFTKAFGIAGEYYLIYAVMVVFAVIWLINYMINMQLGWERVTTYLTQQQRAKEWVKIMVVSFGEFFIVGFCFIGPLLKINPILPLLVIIGLTSVRYTYSMKGWLGQR